MAENDAGFSASDVHGQPPSLPHNIIDVGRAIMESNAQMYGEATAPSSGAAPERAVLNPGPENSIGGAGAALAGAQGPGTSSAKRSRVVVCPKCGQSGQPRGTIVTHDIQSRLLPPNWRLFLTAWVDNKPVHILHTWPTAYDVCERNHKQPGVQEYRKKQFPRPTVAKCYNRLMGGTDLSDFFVAAYFTTLRAARWQPRILFHCIQQAVVNAHILYVHKTGIKKEECRLLDFITKLLCEIRPKPSAPQEAPSRYVKAVISSRPRPWWNSNVKLRTHGPHFADTFSNPRPTEVGQKRADNRNKCIYCRQHKVLTHCAQCGVYLCLGRCFHDFHTLHDFKDPSEIPQNPNPGPDSEYDSS
jgi:hypothetical protein